jgi:hypothetical protein
MQEIDFYKELNDPSDDEDDGLEKCLILNEPLKTNHVTLLCGHKFNYVPIYNYLIIQKTSHLNDNVRLKMNQLRCPYCRSVQNMLLPYYNEPDTDLIIGINSYCCEYKSLNVNYDENDPNSKKWNYCFNQLHDYNDKDPTTKYCEKHKKHLGCLYIFKKGKYQGKHCGHKIKSNYLCCRHIKTCKNNT